MGPMRSSRPAQTTGGVFPVGHRHPGFDADHTSTQSDSTAPRPPTTPTDPSLGLTSSHPSTTPTNHPTDETRASRTNCHSTPRPASSIRSHGRGDHRTFDVDRTSASANTHFGFDQTEFADLPCHRSPTTSGGQLVSPSRVRPSASGNSQLSNGQPFAHRRCPDGEVGALDGESELFRYDTSGFWITVESGAFEHVISDEILPDVLFVPSHRER